MFEVSVTGEFRARHQLRYRDGSTEAPHEHCWRVEVTYGGPQLGETGVLVDFGVIRSRLSDFVRTLEHQDLNDLPLFAARNPSAENVALAIAEHLPRGMPGGVHLKSVAVEEERGCVARYIPGAT